MILEVLKIKILQMTKELGPKLYKFTTKPFIAFLTFTNDSYITNNNLLYLMTSWHTTVFILSL